MNTSVERINTILDMIAQVSAVESNIVENFVVSLFLDDDVVARASVGKGTTEEEFQRVVVDAASAAAEAGVVFHSIPVPA